MGEHDELYGKERALRLEGLLRELAEVIADLDGRGELLTAAAELQKRIGELRSELFHYEVRSTYETPESAEHRRIIEDALAPPDFTNPDEDDDPWRRASE